MWPTELSLVEHNPGQQKFVFLSADIDAYPNVSVTWYKDNEPITSDRYPRYEIRWALLRIWCVLAYELTLYAFFGRFM